MFNFKKFSVEDAEATMKVGTDAVLLGVCADVADNCRILDIGTGCGVVALILAQRCGGKSRIDSVEIDGKSCAAAKRNFANSPWNDRLSVKNTSVQDFADQMPEKYDLIVSNPPFFNNSLKSPDRKRNLARHTESLPFSELIECCIQMLSPTGKATLILPPAEADIFTGMAEKKGLFSSSRIMIFNKPDREVVRVIFTLQKTKPYDTYVSELAIRNLDDTYTDEYLNLTRDFYTFIK